MHSKLLYTLYSSTIICTCFYKNNIILIKIDNNMILNDLLDNIYKTRYKLILEAMS